MKQIALLIVFVSTTSFAPVPGPAPAVYWTRIGVQTSAPIAQACTWETAPARLQQQIEDPIGYPFGLVTSFSCTGDAAAVIAELAERASAMQAEAAAFRASHPITGATP